MRWGGGVGDTASMDRSKLLLSDDLLLELETKVHEVLTVPRIPIHSGNVVTKIIRDGQFG